MPSGNDLVAVQEWDLTATMPSVAANAGIEAVEWVSDDALKGRFWDETTSSWYDPAKHPGHGDGLFFVALEENGLVYAVAPNADGSHSLIGGVDAEMGRATALDWDETLGLLWVTSGNAVAQITLNDARLPTSTMPFPVDQIWLSVEP